MTPATPSTRAAGRRARRLSRAQARAIARGLAATLTEREIEVLQAYVDWAGSAAAACHLELSEATVKGALEHMRAKCGVATTYQLTLVAAHRLTPPHRPNGPLQKQG